MGDNVVGCSGPTSEALVRTQFRPTIGVRRAQHLCLTAAYLSGIGSICVTGPASSPIV